LKEIKEVCPEVTAEEIEARAAKWRRLFPRAVITSAALAANWNRCAWDDLGLGRDEGSELPEGCDWRNVAERMGRRAVPDEWSKVDWVEQELILTEWKRLQRIEKTGRGVA
jgi:hypothetical protein